MRVLLLAWCVGMRQCRRDRRRCRCGRRRCRRRLVVLAVVLVAIYAIVVVNHSPAPLLLLLLGLPWRLSQLGRPGQQRQVDAVVGNLGGLRDAGQHALPQRAQRHPLVRVVPSAPGRVHSAGGWCMRCVRALRAACGRVCGRTRVRPCSTRVCMPTPRGRRRCGEYCELRGGAVVWSGLGGGEGWWTRWWASSQPIAAEAAPVVYWPTQVVVVATWTFPTHNW